MSVIYLLIGVSVVVALIFLLLFFWANKDGQFDDQETPPRRMLFDDGLKKDKNEDKNK